MPAGSMCIYMSTIRIHVYLCYRLLQIDRKKWRSFWIPNCSITAVTVRADNSILVNLVGSSTHLCQVDNHFY